MNIRRLLGLACSLPVLAACTVASGPEQPAAEKAAGEPTYTRTIVRVGADGTPSITTESVTRSEQVARNEARAAAHVTGTGSISKIGVESCGANCVPPGTLTPTSCDGSDLWMWDQTGFNGNELCTFNPTTTVAELDLVIDQRGQMICGYYGCYIPRWAGNVRSYAAGTQGGTFYNSKVGSYYFGPWSEDPWPTSAAVTSATTVYLSP